MFWRRSIESSDNALDVATLKLFTMTTCFGLVANILLARTIATDREDIEGCPVWSWIFGGAMQGCVYPLLAYFAFRSKNVTFKEWCGMSWREAQGGVAEKAWFSVFFGYLLKDMFVMEDELFLLHHVACMLGIVLAMSLPRGAFIHLFAMASLEVGSLFMCLAKILPPSPHIDIRLDRLYWVSMTLSNIICLMAMFYGSYSIDFELRRGVQIGYKIFVGVITVVLVYLRQEVAMINMQESQSRYELNDAEIVRYKQTWIVDNVMSSNVLAGTCIVVSFAVLQNFCSQKKKEKDV